MIFKLGLLILNDTKIQVLLGIFVVLTIIKIIIKVFKINFKFISYYNFIWIFFGALVVADLFSFRIACWILGFLSFFTLREYFSLVDLRIQDRYSVIAAYLSIPFMMYFIHTDWYNMFIITIPVYSFLLIPFFISLGGKDPKGAINSIGLIDFGLFFFVFCMGHIAYLAFFSTWKAAMLIFNVVICDIVCLILKSKKNNNWKARLLQFIIPIPFTIGLTILISPWTKIPYIHSFVLGILIPAIVVIGHQTIEYVMPDLGIRENDLKPGKGLLIDNIKAILFTAPGIFHYIRYFLT